MTQKEAENSKLDFNRRDFLRNASFASLMLAMGGVPLQAEDPPATAATTPADTNYKTIGPPVACAVIGCGVWGREVLQTLAVLPNAPVPAICDTYAPSMNRAREFAPKAELFDDYHKLLDQKSVEAIIVATPTHLHREIVEAALKAGKHVYCEVPLAHTVEDARAIAQAAKAAEKVNFQSGLQMRGDPAKYFVREFIRSGAIGSAIMARCQWHKKGSWRRSGKTPELEKEFNWRLDKKISTGLAGEIGIHQLDLISWFLNEHPMSVTGFGGILNWDDGRDVADTVQTVLQYPSKVNFMFDCTLGNSFDGEYNMLYGKNAAVLMRESEMRKGKMQSSKAWLFQESDSPLLGWEIYATKEEFHDASGISLMADASHSVKKGAVAEESPYSITTLHYALKAFIQNSHVTADAVNNFVSTNGADAEGLKEYLSGPDISISRKPAAGFLEGFEATVTALKANEAIMQGQKILLSKDMFQV